MMTSLLLRAARGVRTATTTTASTASTASATTPPGCGATSFSSSVMRSRARRTGSARPSRRSLLAVPGGTCVGLTLATLARPESPERPERRGRLDGKPSTDDADEVDADAVHADLDLQRPDEDLLQLVDQLSDWGHASEARDVLRGCRGSRRPEVLWRQARVQFMLAEELQLQGSAHAAGTADLVRELINEGYTNLELSLRLDPACGRAHQWMSVLRHARAQLDGTLARLRAAEHIREDMERAVKYLPTDGVCRTMLGMWFFEVAQLSWLERQVVRAAGLSVPDSEPCMRGALQWFQDAERLQPGHSCYDFVVFLDDARGPPRQSLNLLMLGKALDALEGHDSARPALELASSVQPKSQSDAKAQSEARAILQRWKD